jgi:hypothetical protein
MCCGSVCVIIVNITTRGEMGVKIDWVDTLRMR